MKTADGRLQAIDEAIEQFEESWRHDAEELIQRVAGAAGLGEDPELLAELIRVDIDRRYAAGVDVNLQGYFQRFPKLLEEASRVVEICFEDYRVRKSRRKVCVAARWSGFSAVASEAWFQELQALTQVNPAVNQLEFPSTASFISSQLMPGEAAFAPAPPPFTSERIGDFELVALLGEGTFSRVYLARQVSLGRRYVAVKVVDRPMQEPYNLSRLQHTGIVPLYSCHETDGRWVLCMPYSGATTLARWLREQRDPVQRNGDSLKTCVESAQAKLTTHDESQPVSITNPPAEVVQSLCRWHHAAVGPLQQLQGMTGSRLILWMFRRLTSALAHAHQRGLVHGDLKPANILIRNDGEPALIDFNLSQSTESRQRVWIGGTLPYLAREQLQQLLTNSSGPPRPEYDIHALGVILFEILEGRLPFRAPSNSSPEELRAALASHDEPISFNARTGTPGMRAIVKACLKPNSVVCYPTATELLSDIDREIANQPLRYAREPFVTGQLPKVLRRYPRAFSGGFITAVALVVVMLLGVWLSTTRRDQKRLVALTALRKLQQITDETSCNLMYSQVEQSTNNLLGSSEVVGSIVDAMDCLEGESFIDAWDRCYPYLNENEQENARYCVALLSLFGVQLRQMELLRETAAGPDKVPAFSVSADQLSGIFKVVSKELGGRHDLSVLFNEPAGGLTETESVEAESIVSKSDPVVSTAFEQLLEVKQLADRGELEDALAMLERQKPPQSLEVVHWMLRGQLQHSLGRFREAVASLSIVLNSYPNLAPALLCRGISETAIFQFTEAERDFTALLEQDDQFADAWLHRNFARQGLGNFDGALSDLAKAISLRPNSNRYYLTRARLLEKMQLPEEAAADFRTARELVPLALEDRIAFASVMIAVDAERALSELQRAEKLFGPRVRILQTMAHVLSEHLKRESEAITVLDRLLTSQPNYPKALAGRAVLLARAGKIELAIEDLKKLLPEKVKLPPELMFQVASAFSLCSDFRPQLRPQAFRWLTWALAGGYGASRLESDPDLAPLRNDPEFATLRRTAILLEGRPMDSE